jgi:hypothetical protein
MVHLGAENRKIKKELHELQMDMIQKNALISDLQNPENVHLVHMP